MYAEAGAYFLPLPPWPKSSHVNTEAITCGNCGHLSGATILRRSTTSIGLATRVMPNFHFAATYEVVCAKRLIHSAENILAHQASSIVLLLAFFAWSMDLTSLNANGSPGVSFGSANDGRESILSIGLP
ncbi:unnamed protein product [Schistocephalus solidus]|uniref:LITAF domain-containing protein n=1 Tax=Schistocephalus solidus TaxID=70667 RepID=A0A183SIN8_SCHSO|nr:unnamed protein product [Schistocephalus solidus]